MSSSRKDRREEKVLARLRLGHTVLTHGHITRGELRPVCQTCGEDLSVEHIIVECREHDQHRHPLIDFCHRHQLPFNRHSLLCDDHPELLSLVFRFLKDADVYDKL